MLILTSQKKQSWHYHKKVLNATVEAVVRASRLPIFREKTTEDWNGVFEGLEQGTLWTVENSSLRANHAGALEAIWLSISHPMVTESFS